MTAIAKRYPFVTVQGFAADGKQQFIRDQALAISVTFYDSTGSVVTPSSATLTLSYRLVNDACRTHTDYTMTQSGDAWSYTWDSSIAQRGTIFGHIATSSPIYSIDFAFGLIANLANREEAGDDDDNGYIV